MAGQLLDSTYIFQNFWIDLLSIKLKVLFAKFNLLAVCTTISEEFSIVFLSRQKFSDTRKFFAG